MSKKKILSIISFSILGLFLLIVSPISANFLNNVVANIKRIFVGDEVRREFIVKSNITLAPNGDMDKNGEVDAGDIIRFEYILTNSTDKDYSFAILDTNIDRTQLNFIHNVKGTTGIIDDGKTITVPNLRVHSSQIATISFDARINYFTEEDRLISTEPELGSGDKKIISNSLRKEVKAKKIDKEKIRPMLKQVVEKKDKQ